MLGSHKIYFCFGQIKSREQGQKYVELWEGIQVAILNRVVSAGFTAKLTTYEQRLKPDAGPSHEPKRGRASQVERAESAKAQSWGDDQGIGRAMRNPV